MFTHNKVSGTYMSVTRKDIKLKDNPDKFQTCGSHLPILLFVQNVRAQKGENQCAIRPRKSEYHRWNILEQCAQQFMKRE